jgi:SAM-dependent methyltransferase/uncharacterized protein YbaR (Trm112 family)
VATVSRTFGVVVGRGSDCPTFGGTTVTASPTISAEPRLAPVDLLCPECRTTLAFEASRVQPLPDGVFGVLSCPCSAYPVVDGIPVIRRGQVDVQDHMTSRAEVDGPTVAHLVDLVRGDDPLDALVALLAFPPPTPLNLGTKPGLRLPFTRGPWPTLAQEARRGEVRALLGELDTLTAQDWMELCYNRSSDRISGELFPYFFVRFGQPRFLSSIAFLEALPRDRGPILDLACGFGHIMYHLSEREQPVSSVGVDRNFFQLWVGRRYVAPGQSWVCADRLDSLPFADDAFAASVCTDAFHLFPNQQDAMDELRRTAVADTVLLDRVGNAELEPHDTDHERHPAGYVSLVRGAPWRLACEEELFAAYRAGHGVALATPRPPEDFAGRKWLSLISSRDESLFVDAAPFATPPHAAGALRINPIYRIERDEATDGVHLRFEFPSTWYAFENSMMISYTSAGEWMDPATFEALSAGRATERTPSYVDRFVVLGMPPRYARRPGTAPRFGSVGAGLRHGARERLVSATRLVGSR